MADDNASDWTAHAADVADFTMDRSRLAPDSETDRGLRQTHAQLHDEFEVGAACCEQNPDSD